MTAYGQKMRQQVSRWTGIPVRAGIGPSKTLAKLTIHMAMMARRPRLQINKLSRLGVSSLREPISSNISANKYILIYIINREE